MSTNNTNTINSSIIDTDTANNHQEIIQEAQHHFRKEEIKLENAILVTEYFEEQHRIAAEKKVKK